MNRPAPCFALRLLACGLFTWLAGSQVRSQQLDAQPVLFNVTKSTQRLEMIVNTSRILTLDKKIPQFQVANPELLELTPYSARQLQVMARRTGVTRINLWDENNQIYSVDVVVFGDSRELQMVLASQFPRAALTVTPLNNAVIVGGFVDRADHVSRIVQIAEDYHPSIINNITVGGVQQVLLHVKIMEVSRTKLRRMGFDFAHIAEDSFLISSISGLVNPITVTGTGGSNVTFGVLGVGSPGTELEFAL